MTLTEVLRQALVTSGISRYRVSKDTGISWGAIQRFLAGGGMRSAQIDRLSDYLGLKLVSVNAAPAKEPPQTARKSAKRTARKTAARPRTKARR